MNLQSIAAAGGGAFKRGPVPYAAVPWKGKKKSDRSLHIFINGDDIGVKVFRDDVSWTEAKDYARELAGMAAWRPRRRKALSPVATASYAVRNHFFGETLAVCRMRRQISAQAFALLINDLRLRGDADREAVKYAREFGVTSYQIEQAMSAPTRHHSADDRAKILNLTYAERQHLGLRRTGSIDVDKAGRERARRDRYNAKRRAARAAARLPGVNKSSQVEESLEGGKKEEEKGTTEIVRTEMTTDTEQFYSKPRTNSNVTEARQHLCGPGRGRSANIQASSARRNLCGEDHGANLASARRRSPARRPYDPHGNREQQTRVDRASASGGVGHSFRPSELVLWRGMVRGRRRDRPRWRVRGCESQPSGCRTKGRGSGGTFRKIERQIRN